jgi:hypothetical protein
MPAPLASTLVELLAILANSRDRTSFDPAFERAFELVGFPAELPLPEDLTPDQRKLAEVLATRSSVAVMSSVCLPYFVQFRRRWLGIAPGGALEQRHTFVHEGSSRTWPLWKIWGAVGDDPKAATGISALGIPRIELLDAYVDDALWRPYPSRAIDKSRVYGHLDLLGAEGGDWARRRLAEVASWPRPETQQEGEIRYVKSVAEPLGFETFQPSTSLSGHALLPLFVALARSGGAVEPAWEPFLPCDGNAYLTEIAAAIPEDRREAALVAGVRRALDKDALFAVLRLWPSFPYVGLAAVADGLFADKSFVARAPRPALQTWRARWKELRAATPVRGEAATVEATAAKKPAKRASSKK